jgi:SAM-dependent methyltransferase
MAPVWMDFAALLQSHRPPRMEEGEPFRYLELGCGMGLGLCQMAVAYPEAEFVGVDFNPAHVAHARRLATELKIGNLQILDADFLSLASNPAPLLDTAHHSQLFHYVAAHGIYTWVTAPVREALVNLASSVLHPGGIFFCSYNTYPGWLARSAFQKLLWHELGRSDPGTARSCFERSINNLSQLLGSPDGPTPLGAHHPFLHEDLASLDLDRLQYLNGEYANAGWEPVYVADLHQHCAIHRLTYLTSATLPDCFEQLLAPSLKAVVLQERNPLIRHTLLDLATNKAFRRDVFVKGIDRLTAQETQRRLSQLTVVPLQPLPLPIAESGSGGIPSPYLFNTTFGQVVGDPAVYEPIAAAIEAGGCTVMELQAISGDSADELPMVLALFLDAGMIALHRGAAGVKAEAVAHTANQAMLELIHAGRPYAAVVLPQVGISVAFSLVEALILQAHQQGLKGEMVTACVSMAIADLGIELLDASNQPLTTTKAAMAQLIELADAFLQQRLPVLQRLGAFGTR